MGNWRPTIIIRIPLCYNPHTPPPLPPQGHSMGGHGALTLALRNPSSYKSASAFSPVCNPSNVPWGIKAFTGARLAVELLRGKPEPQTLY